MDGTWFSFMKIMDLIIAKIISVEPVSYDFPSAIYLFCVSCMQVIIVKCNAFL